MCMYDLSTGPRCVSKLVKRSRKMARTVGAKVRSKRKTRHMKKCLKLGGMPQ